MGLCDVKKNQTVKILEFKDGMSGRELLMGMGLLPGDCITVIGTSFLGSPITILKGEDQLLALRKSEAKHIITEVI